MSEQPTPTSSTPLCDSHYFDTSADQSFAHTLEALYNEAQREISSLRSQLVEAQKDGERLDWLEKAYNEHDLVFKEGDPDVGVFSAWQVWRPARGDSKPLMVGHDSTIRAAIDRAAARTASPSAR